MTGERVVLRDLVELLHQQVHDIALGTVDHPLLGRRVDLSPGHVRRLSPERFEGVEQHRAAHDSNLEPLQIIRGANRSLRIPCVAVPNVQ